MDIGNEHSLVDPEDATTRDTEKKKSKTWFRISLHLGDYVLA